MAGSLTDLGENEILDWLAANKLLFVGLFTGAPGESAAGVEVAGNGYARQAVSWSAASGGVITNANLVQFPAASPAAWGNIVAHAYFPTLSGGLARGWSEQLPNEIVNVGTEVRFEIGALIFSGD